MKNSPPESSWYCHKLRYKGLTTCYTTKVSCNHTDDAYLDPAECYPPADDDLTMKQCLTANGTIRDPAEHGIGNVPLKWSSSIVKNESTKFQNIIIDDYNAYDSCVSAIAYINCFSVSVVQLCTKVLKIGYFWDLCRIINDYINGVNYLL